MSGGLVALLDDVAAIARLAASTVDDASAAAVKVSSKAVGVVVDDAAVTPSYVTNLSPSRELPIIWKITKGSLMNKLVFILPAILLLSVYLPQAIAPVLLLGGLYLSYEGAEKVYEAVTGNGHGAEEDIANLSPEELEKKRVASAIRTDFILSAEIMVISLGEIINEPILDRAITLIIVGIAITILVYGVVGMLVKIDDLGLRLTKSNSPKTQRLGRTLVEGMPVVLHWLSIVGTAAMLWVGGHILISNIAELGIAGPQHFAHDAAHAVSHAIPFAQGVTAWFTDSLISAVVGLAIGLLIVGLMHLIPSKAGKEGAAH